MSFCTSCGKEIKAGLRFCNFCGKEQIVSAAVCSKCGKMLEENEKFCFNCGTPANAFQEAPKSGNQPKAPKLTREGRKIIDAGPKPALSKSNKTILPPPVAPISKKEKKGCMGCLGKSLLGILVLLIVGVVIIWYLSDEDSNSSKSEEQITISNNFEDLNVDLSRSQTVVGDLNQNGIELSIPKETFDQNINLQVKESKTAPSFDKKRAKLVGIPFEISIDQKSKRLNKPVTIKLKLNKQEISRIKYTDDLRIGYFNGTQWDYFKPQEVNIKKEFVKFETLHLSEYSKANLTEEEQLNDFANTKAMDQWSKKNNNAPTRHATENIVKQILGEKLGLTDKNITQNIVESIMNENDYAKLLVSYNDNNMEQFGQDLAILAGKKIVDAVTNDSRAKTLLGGVTEHASKINAGINIARALSDGDLEKAAKELSMEIINTFPITKLYREAAKVIDLQIVSWRDKEVEAAYKVYVNGAQSSIPFWGYNVEPGNFEDVWIQMKGLKPQLLRDAKDKYAKANGVKVEDLGTRILDNIEAQTKENLKQKFELRAKQEEEIAKMKEQNLKLLKEFESAKLFEEGRFGYPDNTSFDLRLERLYKIKDMILKDTGCGQIGFLGVAEGGIIPAKTVARLIQIWYNPDDGKEKYREELVKLGYLKELEELELEDGPWEISFYEAKEFYNELETEEFDNWLGETVGRAAREALPGHEAADDTDNAMSDEAKASLKKKWTAAIKKLNAEYDNSLSLGFVNAPKATYEKPEEDQILFLYKYNPIEENGVYTFTIRNNFELEEGEEIKLILMLKSNEYFEAKVFYYGKASVSIDYMKGKLKE